MNCLKGSVQVRVFAIVLTMLLLAAEVACGTTGPAPAPTPTPLTSETWKVVPSLNPGSSGNFLKGAMAVSAHDIWVVGDYNKSSGILQTLIEHWNGTSWQVIPSPNVGSHDNLLNGVAAVSPNNVWAVGNYLTGSGIAQTLIEHWNGSSWQIVPSPNVGEGGVLSGVAVVSASDAWAVGNSPTRTLTEHWNGTSWQVVPSPNVQSSNNFLTSVAVVSAQDVWAVGNYLNSDAIPQTLTEHWNGTSWQVVSSPIVGEGGALNGVAVVSASDIWAVGSSPGQTLTEHWNGTSWQVVPSPNPGSNDNLLNGVAVVSPNNVWAVGDYLNSDTITKTLIEHWNGTSWQVVPSPNVGPHDNLLNGVAQIPGASNIWAVGYDYKSSSSILTLTDFYY